MSGNLLINLFSLKGKTALITGGYKGIGRLFADTYAEAGADVAIVARSLEGCQRAAMEIREKFGVKTLWKAMDVNKTHEVNRIVQEIVDELGKVDILVNSAGISGSQKPVLKMTDEDIDEVMAVDFRGVFAASRAVAKHMSIRKCGKIINISSVLGKLAARDMSGYCASKAAVTQLTKVMALELIRDNIQVNVLCPGYFLTEFNRGFFDSDAGKNLVKKMIPIDRVGDLEELRSTALYLATCPAFLTGAEIYVDGGHSIS
ncbi:MAG: SDR family NAD(P)-dependent oxidoreductase [Deltaproteobacteria bacterium]|nr:SDR family NAD(P)-dependent oxidoreductase [Deltaproteobacteria bacterium]